MKECRVLDALYSELKQCIANSNRKERKKQNSIIKKTWKKKKYSLGEEIASKDSEFSINLQILTNAIKLFDYYVFDGRYFRVFCCDVRVAITLIALKMHARSNSVCRGIAERCPEISGSAEAI